MKAINVDASAWRHYSTGVFTGCNTTNSDIDHVVLLVGYGILLSFFEKYYFIFIFYESLVSFLFFSFFDCCEGTDPNLGDYWLIRNSWTPAWGEGNK